MQRRTLRSARTLPPTSRTALPSKALAIMLCLVCSLCVTPRPAFADDAVAANRVVVNPYFSSATDAVSCSYQTPHGRVAVRWRRMADGIEVAVMAPEGIELDMTNLATRAGVSVVREA